MDPYELFHKLAQNKQDAIINAGFEVFGRHGYKKANTIDIAKKAGISKGLLFYYFKNKESYYLYLCHFSEQLVLQQLQNTPYTKITDFFDFIAYETQEKMKMVAKYPHLMDFAVSLTLSKKEEIQSANEFVADLLQNSYQAYFEHVDFTKFREDIDPMEILQMFVWTVEGYLLDQERTHQNTDIQKLLKQTDRWLTLYKKMSYKEDYL